MNYPIISGPADMLSTGHEIGFDLSSMIKERTFFDEKCPKNSWMKKLKLLYICTIKLSLNDFIFVSYP